MSTRIVDILPVEKYPSWDSFVGSSPQGSVFQTRAWIETMAGQFHLQPQILVAMEDDRIVGGIVLYLKKRFGIQIATQPPATPYNGVIHMDDREKKPQKKQADEAEITELLLHRIEQEVRYAHFSLSPAIDDARPYHWCQWNTHVQFTYWNSLRDLTAGWEALSPSLRRKITRAREKTYTISETGDIATLVSLQEQSYSRSRQRPVIGNDVYVNLCTVLRDKGLAKVYSISDQDGRVHSSRAIVLSGRTAFYWISGSQPSTAEDSTSHLLLWEIFERLSKAGIERFDFMGANTPSIVEFKRSFGGTLVNYYDVSWYKPKVLKILIEANNLTYAIRRRM
jgi:CelD/BcsL family acetyltransferase involved in cellulose biosynthesis